MTAAQEPPPADSTQDVSPPSSPPPSVPASGWYADPRRQGGQPVTKSPALVIRSYLDDHDGRAEVSLHNLFTTWNLETADPEQRAGIERDLARTGIAVEPSTAELNRDDEVTLLLSELVTPSSGNGTPAVAPAAPAPPPALPGQPPVSGDEGERRVGRLRKPWVAALAAVGIGLVGGGGVVAYVKLADDSKEAAAAALTSGRDTLSSVAGELNSAEQMADINSAGQDAARAVPRVEEELTRVEAIEDEQVRAPVGEALAAELTILQSLAGLADDRKPDVGSFEAVDRAVRGATLTLEQTTPRIKALELEGVDRLPAAPIVAATQNAGGVIQTGARKLARWRGQVARIKRETKGELAAMNSYATSMRGYLTTYDGLRSSMDEWIQKVDSEGATFEESYDFLASASSERAAVRQSIVALDAPAALATAHNNFLGVLDSAVGAVDSAYTGIAEYESDFFGEEYVDYKDTPGWRTFRSESEGVSEEYGSARATLESSILQEQRKIERRHLPPKPEV